MFPKGPAGIYISRIAAETASPEGCQRGPFSSLVRQLRTCHHLRSCKSYGITGSLEIPAGRPLDRAAEGEGDEGSGGR